MQLLAVFRSRRVLVVALLGFASGLPLLLTSQTLAARLAADGVGVVAIGALALVGLPYAFKWAWAPLLDRYRLPFLGRRRGWLLALQLALALALLALGAIDPRAAPAALAACAVAVAFLSASHDVVVDAFTTDTLAVAERAAGSATYVSAYRAGMLAGGALALALADWLTWSVVYAVCAALMGVGVLGTLLAAEPDGAARRPTSLGQAVWRPLAGLLAARGAALALGFVALFRLGDHLVMQLAMPFLTRELGFSFTEIAGLYHLLGFAGTLLGGLLAGGLVARLGLRRCLFAFGAAQALANLGWAALATRPPSLVELGVVVVADNLANAMGAAAFVAFLMSRCDRAVSAAQFAFLTSLSSLGARLLAAPAGALVVASSWSTFWLATTALALPGLALVPFLPRDDAPLPPAFGGGR